MRNRMGEDRRSAPTLVARALELFDRLGLTPACSAFEHGDRLALPRAASADYRFALWIYTDGQAEIAAEFPDLEWEPFWRRSFEKHAFDDAERLAQSFLELAGDLARSPSRIVVRRGWVFLSATCEYWSDSTWHSAGAVAYGRWLKGLPRLTGQAATFLSSSPAPK